MNSQHSSCSDSFRGSPMSTNVLRYVGTLIRTHGISGALVLQPDPAVRLEGLPPGEQVYVGYSATFAQPYTVRHCRRLQRGLLIEFEGVTTLNAAQRLREQGIFVREELLGATNSADYAVEEILGCTVLEDPTGHLLGTVVDVWLLPANDVWVVETATAYLPVPAIPEVIRQVDIQQRCIWVKLLPGLVDIAEPKLSHGRARLDERTDED